MYVPKYVLKRLVPVDAVKLIDGILSVEIINVFTPIPFNLIPGDIAEILEITWNGKLMFDASHKELYDKVTITWNNMKFSLNRIKEVAEGTLAVGDKMIISMPNVFDVKKGETHKIGLKIKIDPPITIDIERTLC